MDRIAFIIGDTVLYWNSIVLVLAGCVGICLFLAFFLWSGGSGGAGAVAVPMAMVLSLLLGRLTHWYFLPDSYPDFLTAMTDYTSGGYTLLGVFLGCGLTAVILRLMGLEKDLLVTLDAMCLAGCGGIALGRLGCFFTGSHRGALLENLRSLPWVYPVNNVVTGAEEYRLATFLLQAAAAALIFGLLTAFFFLARRKKGDVTLLLLLLYGLSQAVLDSTRYDSLCLRSNGFIHAVQLLGALAMVTACVILSVQLVKGRGFRAWLVPVWLAMAALLGGGGYMEYYVQRHGDQALFSYGIMTVCLSGVAALALTIMLLRNRKA